MPIKVTSSAIEEYDYDPRTRELTIKWVKGATYVYTKVPPDKVAAISDADATKGQSVGMYVNKEIVPFHEGIRV